MLNTINELETYAKQTIENNGNWFELENDGEYCLCKSQSWFCVKHNYYGDTVVYQVFRLSNGKRLYATQDYQTAYWFWKEGDKNRTLACLDDIEV